MNWKEVAKFFCGFEAFHAVFHAYLWVSGTPFLAYGITTTPPLNLAGAIVSGSVALFLGIYGWRPRPRD